jgi:hypothetical protein
VGRNGPSSIGETPAGPVHSHGMTRRPLIECGACWSHVTRDVNWGEGLLTDIIRDSVNRVQPMPNAAAKRMRRYRQRRREGLRCLTVHA